MPFLLFLGLYQLLLGFPHVLGAPTSSYPCIYLLLNHTSNGAAQETLFTAACPTPIGSNVASNRTQPSWNFGSHTVPGTTPTLNTVISNNSAARSLPFSEWTSDMGSSTIWPSAGFPSNRSTSQAALSSTTHSTAPYSSSDLFRTHISTTAPNSLPFMPPTTSYINSSWVASDTRSSRTSAVSSRRL